jgi:hypothetical protein
VSCYRRSRGSLFRRFKHCLDNMFVAQEAFRAFNNMNYAG